MCLCYNLLFRIQNMLIIGVTDHDFRIWIGLTFVAAWLLTWAAQCCCYDTVNMNYVIFNRHLFQFRELWHFEFLLFALLAVLDRFQNGPTVFDIRGKYFNKCFLNKKAYYIKAYLSILLRDCLNGTQIRQTMICLFAKKRQQQVIHWNSWF